MLSRLEDAFERVQQLVVKVESVKSVERASTASTILPQLAKIQLLLNNNKYHKLTFSGSWSERFSCAAAKSDSSYLSRFIYAKTPHNFFVVHRLVKPKL